MNLTAANITTGFFGGIDGRRLYYKVWTPETSPKAVVAIVHGAGEHIDRYSNVIQALLPAGYAVAGFDLRGHGRSEGQRGHILSWDEYRGDVRLFLDLVRSLLLDTPLFLYGHSLGSLIALDFILHHPAGLRGAILSGSVFELKDAAPPHLVLIARALSRLVPAFSLKVPLPGASLSRDPQVARAYDEDPMVFRDRTARWGTENLKMIDWVKRQAQHIDIPVLFLHGEDDPLLSVDGVRRFFEQIEFPDKTLKVYPAGLHELHNDLDHAQVTDDILAWIADHLDHA